MKTSSPLPDTVRRTIGGTGSGQWPGGPMTIEDKATASTAAKPATTSIPTSARRSGITGVPRSNRRLRGNNGGDVVSYFPNQRDLGRHELYTRRDATRAPS